MEAAEADIDQVEAKEPSNKYVDQITLELLLNKTRYQKYLSKSDPQKFVEYQEFSENCNRMSRPILDMTMRLLQDPGTDRYSQEVKEAFERYSRVLIRFLEIKEMTDHFQEVREDDDDEDTLFPASMNDPIVKGLDEMQNTMMMFHVPRTTTMDE